MVDLAPKSNYQQCNFISPGTREVVGGSQWYFGLVVTAVPEQEV